MNELILDGKKYKLSPELVEKIKAEVAEQEKAENPFERRTDDKGYFYINERGEVKSALDRHFSVDDRCFVVANYCCDEELIKQRALHEILNLLLWRYSEEHGGDTPWNGINKHWYILMEGGDMKTNYFCSSYILGAIYFKNRETADAAIKEIVEPFISSHPEFVW